ncbi:hypothetical protein KIN20_012962 [Parelaphostrongylus tenuis]|uniref:Uncharacterized protein n=1 Tax=Parelaphostrongylus tenuis TaxID=148309 RepID=A0AAD5MU15_PARTN|nr:hypothetical protein KIN20_012962 [Parelaphostrongylus tenuis]
MCPITAAAGAAATCVHKCRLIKNDPLRTDIRSEMPTVHTHTSHDDCLARKPSTCLQRWISPKTTVQQGRFRVNEQYLLLLGIAPIVLRFTSTNTLKKFATVTSRIPNRSDKSS